MDLKKLFVGGIIGGIANFFLGWLIWGILLMKFMRDHSNPTASVIFRTEADMVWWSLIVGNIALGFLVTYVLMKSSVKTAGTGAATGFVLGLLIAGAVNGIQYAQMKVYGITALAVDVLAAAVVSCVAGAVVGWFLGRGTTAS